MDLQPASVLVIENHPMMREAICSAIAAETDLQVVRPAMHSTEAIQLVIAIEPDALLLSRKPDIILLALGNPGKDGLEALKTLRASLSETPILVLTSNEVPGQEQFALEAGARAVLTKAASRGEIIEALRELRTRLLWKRSNPKLEADNGISS